MFIEVVDLTKTFRRRPRRSGVLCSVAGLFDPRYETVIAVDRIDFHVDRGEFLGCLGPNGAGKSTTIKMLTGIVHPSAGSIHVGGLDPFRDRTRHVARLGVLFGQRTSLWWDLPVADSFELLRHIYGVPRQRFLANLRLFTDLLELGPFLATPVRQLSLGQRMRADLAAVFLHDPEILFLDEPTIGLDVTAKDRIRSFIGEMNHARGTTVILTSHDLDDVEALCRRLILLDRGKLVFDGSPDRLVEQYGGERELVVEFAADYPDVTVPGATLAAREGRRASYRFPRRELAPLMESIGSRFQWIDLTLREPDIESTLRRIYESSGKGGEALDPFSCRPGKLSR